MIAAAFIALAILLIIGTPISVAMVLAAVISLLLNGNVYSLDLIVQKLYSQCESFPLLAIPLFVFAGGIMAKGGMSDRLIRFASSLVGKVHGGLAIVSVIACIFFAAISGSTAATTAAIGTVLIPAIIKSGFSKGSATALQATAGSIGIIIPPSIPFVLLGVISGISIGKLFLGGVIPGMLTGLALMIVCYITAKVQKHELAGDKINIKEVLHSGGHAILPLLTVVFIMGGITMGIVTPTEAAILAVNWALFVSIFIYRSLKWKELPAIMVDTVCITGVVVLCIGATSPFAWLLTVEQFPQDIANAMLEFTQNPICLKLLMLIVLLAVGTFLDLTPAMIILVPIFMPIAMKLNMDPVQFGVVVVMALGIGQCTPPVGIALFVACSISKIKIGHVIIPLFPFLFAMLLILLATCFWEPLTTWLPDMLMRQ